MKKIAMMFVLIAGTVVFFSCCNSTPKASLKDDADTLSYSVGLTEGSRYVMNLSRMDIDSAHYKDFVRGVIEGAKGAEDIEKMAYYIGLNVGMSIEKSLLPQITVQAFGSDSVQTLPLDNLVAGFANGITGKKQLMTPEDAANTAERKMQELQAIALEAEFGENRIAGEEFLAANAKKEGVIQLPSGVQYEVVKEGKGIKPADTSWVEIKYRGMLIDGTPFDSTMINDTRTSRANQFVPGFTEALTNMPVGSVWRVYIPQKLAYGQRRAGKIKPFSTLIFDIELVTANQSLSEKNRAKNKK